MGVVESEERTDGGAMVKKIHVIPVDASLTPEDAWKEICIFGQRVTYSGSETWATIECDREECRSIEVADD
jgi:hypothetical protein